jgi:hypothetical protein
MPGRPMGPRVRGWSGHGYEEGLLSFSVPSRSEKQLSTPGRPEDSMMIFPMYARYGQNRFR